MPVYEYQCPNCQHTDEAVRSIANRKDSPDCTECGRNMNQQVLTAPKGYVSPDLNYWCPSTGKQVTSWSQRNRIMDEKELVDARELDPPDFAKMEQDAVDVRKPDVVPEKLAGAMRDAGMGDML